MVASISLLPEIGVPIGATCMAGEDALLSIGQMPAGVPVATVAIHNATNAGALAAQILASSDDTLRGRVADDKRSLERKVLAKADGTTRPDRPAASRSALPGSGRAVPHPARRCSRPLQKVLLPGVALRHVFYARVVALDIFQRQAAALGEQRTRSARRVPDISA